MSTEPRTTRTEAGQKMLAWWEQWGLPTELWKWRRDILAIEAEASAAAPAPLDVERLAKAMAFVQGVRDPYNSAPSWEGFAAKVAARYLALAAAPAQPAEPCSCGGRRWVDDENWQPLDRRTWKGERYPGDGLIPCGFCNEGGWDTPLAAPAQPAEEPR